MARAAKRRKRIAKPKIIPKTTTKSELKAISSAYRVGKISVGKAGEEKVLDTVPDVPDLRDRLYEPPLIEMSARMNPPGNIVSPILDQGSEGSCTGFGLSTIVNLLLNRRLEQSGLQLRTGSDLVSPRMIYEMAKIHDEWHGEAYDGSSIRGALKGFFHNGICTLKVAPYKPGDKNWRLSVERAKDARNVGLGAYYRLRPQMIDYHAALNQTGAIYVSARTHTGWRDPKDGRIKLTRSHEGGHAFTVVGYDEAGFLIQNSWGAGWGGYAGWPGIAHWCYDDWAENVYDAWALRLAVPTPTAFDLTHISVSVDSATGARIVKKPEPRREDILGHYIHVDDGKFVDSGRYAVNLDNVKETAKFLADDAAKPEPNYQHLMFYAHGGLNDEVAAARRVAGMKDPFKRNGIYPIHFMWESGFAEEFKDILRNIFVQAEQRVGGVRDFLDAAIERGARGLGLRLWREMKRDAERAFVRNAAGLAAAKVLLEANAAQAKPRPIHLVGHSAGAIVIAEMLKALDAAAGNQKIASISLMAPACTVALYREAYTPALAGGPRATVKRLRQYNLTDKRELDDNVSRAYGKSLLYLVSNAFEEARPTPILGMEVSSRPEKLPANHEIFYAGRDTSRSDSTSHGGFDNDRATMNDILATILGAAPPAAKAFQQSDLDKY